MEQLFDAVGCCSADVYEDREAARFVEGDEDVQPLLPDRCAEVLGLASPEASYMDLRKAYIRAALVFSRLVGPVAPWREKRGFERRGGLLGAVEGKRAQGCEALAREELGGRFASNPEELFLSQQ